MDLAEAIQQLIRHGRDLREAGVRDLRVGDLYVTLAPPDIAPDDDDTAENFDGDPLNDPLTYGRRSGVPGITREDDA
jgi:hypothetical protein